MKVELKEYECVCDKYEVITIDKQDSLGSEMTLKELLDLYWNRVDIYNGSINIGCAYKCIDGRYEIEIDSAYKFDNKKLLKSMVLVNDYFDRDDDDYPIVECSLLEL